jgi:hypothetical protein
MVKSDVLQALLATNLEVESDVFIKRLGGSFRIKAMDTVTLAKAREQATHVTAKGRSTVDETRLKAIAVTKFCVIPNFGDAALMAKYGAMNAVDCVEKALLPGEIERILDAGMALSGYGDDDEEAEIDEIKN